MNRIIFKVPTDEHRGWTWTAQPHLPPLVVPRIGEAVHCLFDAVWRVIDVVHVGNPRSPLEAHVILRLDHE